MTVVPGVGKCKYLGPEAVIADAPSGIAYHLPESDSRLVERALADPTGLTAEDEQVLGLFNPAVLREARGGKAEMEL